MTNEMMRPCIIKDISESPFDACIAEVFKDSEDLEAYILLREEKNRMCLFKHYVKCNSIEELDAMYNSWVCSLADALNAPVLASKKVLAGLPSEGRFLAHNVPYTKFGFKDNDCIYRLLDNKYIDSKILNGSDDSVEIVKDSIETGLLFEIQGENQIAREYLRQFTLDGKRIKQKEMN